MQGVAWGVIALPAGLVLGGVVLGLAPGTLLKNLWPVMALCAGLCLALRFAPRGCIRVLGGLGAAVWWLGILLFCWMAFGLFVPEVSVLPPEVVEEVLVIVLKITVVVCGSLVAGQLVLARCGRWLDWAASRLGVNEYAVLGLLTSLVSSVSMLPLYPRMDVRGKRMNAAFTVSGAFVLGGQMAFAASVSDGRAVAAYFAAKLAGGVVALLLVFCFAKKTKPKENRIV